MEKKAPKPKWKHFNITWVVKHGKQIDVLGWQKKSERWRARKQNWRQRLYVHCLQGERITWHFELNCHDICNHLLELIYDFRTDRSIAIAIALIFFCPWNSIQMYGVHSLDKLHKLEWNLFAMQSSQMANRDEMLTTLLQTAFERNESLFDLTTHFINVPLKSLN